MEIIEFESWHLEHLRLQDAQSYMLSYITPEYGQLLEEAGPSFTALHHGVPKAAAGIVMCHPQRALSWALLSAMGPQQFLPVHRGVKAFLDRQTIRRIEANVDVSFPQGHRWIRALGFELEAPRMRAYSPEGRDYALYSRINEEDFS